MRITRRLEFDAGHRIPDHASQCRHLHGHRYALEVTLSGNFADVKKVANEMIVDRWDHAFLVYRDDTQVAAFLASMPGHKTVTLDVVPTAENLAAEAFRVLDGAYQDVYGNQLQLERVRLYETPNCWADAVRGER
ncbi:MAG: 6-carboxytetrahydropterin synthase QueD [Betaproteobacteria bacterium HGW-Betaproteobacteria-13]|nr:MAG: 6-carboxytetrahydropterin synthase QueD [Betaproteobacteria bacterium HGW-Betaproteobacteria-13]